MVYNGDMNPPHIFVPYNGKIADINEDDQDTHYLDLEAALSETRMIVALILVADRQGGAGNLLLHPNEGTYWLNSWTNVATFIGIAKDSQRLKYEQSAANDDFDLYCLGYWVAR